VTNIGRSVVSEVRVRLRHSHGHHTPTRLIDLTPHLLRRRAAPAPPPELPELPELTSHRVQGVAETDCSWGLLLVPISVCVALFVYASVFFP